MTSPTQGGPFDAEEYFAELESRRAGGSLRPGVSITTSTDAFRDAIRSAGLEPPEHIQPGRFHRFPGAEKGNGNTAGWCFLFEDGEGGVFGDWSTDLSETWQAKRKRTRSEAECAEFRRKVAKAKEKTERERKAAQEAAAMRADEIWKAAELAPANHLYLKTKGIQPHGARLHKRSLVVPLRDGRQLCSLEFVDTEGGKRFLRDGRTAGCYYSLGQPDGTVYVCEGFATGTTIHEATGQAVAVAFNAGNLEPVAKALKEKYPNVAIIIAADNDVRDDDSENTGIVKATAAAKAIGGRLAVPKLNGAKCDFNDVHQARGLDEVRRQLSGGNTRNTSAESAALLNDIRDFIGRFCVFPDQHCLIAVTLWAAHTHIVEHLHTTPRLALLSPEAGSGKTRVLEVLDLLVPEPLFTLNASPAAVFRTLANERITLLFDEVDAIWSKHGKDDNHEDLRALLNSGYKVGATIPRCVGPKHDVTRFEVFCAVALAGLGVLPRARPGSAERHRRCPRPPAPGPPRQPRHRSRSGGHRLRQRPGADHCRDSGFGNLRAAGRP